MTRFLLVTNAKKDPQYAVTRLVTERLLKNGGYVAFGTKQVEIAAHFGVDTAPETLDGFDAVIVIGGDGSVLDASVCAIQYDLPLLGINLGRLGYLAELETDELQALDRLFDSQYEIQDRMTLSLELLPNDRKSVVCERCALNEISVSHMGHNGIADMFLTDNMGNRIHYRGDGLLLATPSGSTAYSFSAGGPVIDPTLEAICVTPVCPHSFFNRSMLLGASAVITVENTTKNDSLYVSVDGRTAYELSQNEKIVVRRADRRLRMISFGKIPTFTSLRRKMELAELKE